MPQLVLKTTLKNEDYLGILKEENYIEKKLLIQLGTFKIRSSKHENKFLMILMTYKFKLILEFHYLCIYNVL